MNVKLGPELFAKLKKVDVRIKKSFKEKIVIFAANPLDPQLHNHELQKPYVDVRSIDVTNDYRALYREKDEGAETVAYFEDIGTHEQLYKQNHKASKN